MVALIERYCVGLCASLLALLIASSVWSEEPPSAVATVRANGEHVLQLMPQKIRLQLVAKAEGSDANEAVAVLARHKERVRDELLALKADAESIEMAPVDISKQTMGIPEQYRGVSNKILIKMLDGSVNVNIEDLPVVFTATCIIEADWTLPTSDADVLLKLPNSIRAQVAERDLAGDENRLQLSPEQEGRIETFMAAFDEHLGMGYYDDTDGSDQDQRIIYVASVAPEARLQALKAAFAQARDECAALAEASGNQLGRMVSLVKAAPSDSTESWLISAAADGVNDLMISRDARSMARNEFIAPRPDLLLAKFQVRATFEIAQ